MRGLLTGGGAGTLRAQTPSPPLRDPTTFPQANSATNISLIFFFKLAVQQTSASLQRTETPCESYGAVRYNQPRSTSQRQCGFKEGPPRKVYFHYQKRAAIYPEESE